MNLTDLHEAMYHAMFEPFRSLYPGTLGPTDEFCACYCMGQEPWPQLN